MFFGKRFSGHQSGSFSGLDILVLSVIKNFDGISGYDIIHEINSKFRNLWRASPGTIYPLLNRLHAKDYIKVEEITKNNRLVKIYRITETGANRLKAVLKNNFETSMNTLGEYIRTIVQTWVPNEKNISYAMSCFPHCRPSRNDMIDEEDCSLQNIERVNRIISDLNDSKEKLSARLEEVEKRLTHFKNLLKRLENDREAKSTVIEIVDEEEYEKEFEE